MKNLKKHRRDQRQNQNYEGGKEYKNKLTLCINIGKTGLFLFFFYWNLAVQALRLQNTKFFVHTSNTHSLY